MKKFIKALTCFSLGLCFYANVNAQAVEDWNGFGGNEQNNKITYAKTLTSNEDVEVKKSIKATGFANDPIIIGDKMYAVVSNVLTEYDKDGNETGRKVAAPVGFFSKIAYGDNKIFVASKSNIVAYDLVSFEPIWKTADVSGGQALSAITYHDGYIYSGYTSGGTSAPSKGFFFALATVDEDVNNTGEIKDYTWTYPQATDLSVAENGSGYYWADAAIVNNAVVFAGDNGVVVSHHLTKDIIFDKYQLSQESSVKKIRATIIYDKSENAVFVGTQDSHELYKIPFIGRTFNVSKIKKTDQIAQISGGFAVGEKNLYIPSGGMYGKGFTIIDKDLENVVGVASQYGTQSIPLVSEFENGITYFYFLEYNTGKLIIGKDLNDGTMPTFSEYKHDDMQTYNSFSAVPFYDGTLVVPFNGFNSGGFIFIDSLNKEVTKTDVEALINKTDNLTKYYDYDKMLDIQKRVANFKETNPDVLLSNESKLTTNNALLEADINEKKASLKNDITQNDWLGLEENIALASNIPNVEIDEINITNADKIWNDFENLSDQDILAVANNVYSKILESGSAENYQTYIKHLSDNQAKIEDETTKEKVSEIIANANNAAKIVEDNNAVKKLDELINGLPEVNKVTLKLSEALNGIKLVYDASSIEVRELYVTSSMYQKYQTVVKEFDKQFAFLKKISQDIESVNPQKVTLNDEKRVNDIITRYNSLSKDNRDFGHDNKDERGIRWFEYYQDVLDAKNKINKITTETVKSGQTITTYHKISGKWVVVKKEINNTKQRVISTYKNNKRTTYYKEVKSGRIIKSKQKIVYNSKAQIVSNLIKTRNKKAKYVNTYYNKRVYYKNNKLKASKIGRRNVNTNRYTSIKTAYYYTNGKRLSLLSNYYSKNKLVTKTYYRYNKKSQLKTNRYGKATYTLKKYKKGKVTKTYHYKYSAKGKKVRQ